MKVSKALVYKLLVLTVILLPLSSFAYNKVNALAITSMSITGTNITSGASSVSTAVTPTINFTLGTSLNSSQTLRITLNGLTVSNAGGLASADITAGGGCSGTVTLAGSPIANATANPVLSLTGLTCTTSAATIIIASSRLTTSSSAGNNTISITTPSDNGAFLFYIGSANQVTVTAQVDPILSFVIRNAADSADLTPGATGGARVCDIGTLAVSTTPVPGATNTCQYRLRIATNATSGFTTTYVSTSVDSTGGGFARLAASSTVNIPNQTGGNAGDPLSSNNGYGVQLTPGTSLSRGTTFGSTGANYYTITANSATQMLTASAPYAPATAPDTSLTTLVTHGARISASQQSGAYSHTITYTVTGNF